jgi:CRISPR-associated endonuclease/helicase Cas3
LNFAQLDERYHSVIANSYAHGDRQPLVQHLLVGAVLAAKMGQSLNLEAVDVKTLFLGTLAHDKAKIMRRFQRIYYDEAVSDSDLSRHHDLGWALQEVLHAMLGPACMPSFESWHQIKNLTYFHHPHSLFKFKKGLPSEIACVADAFERSTPEDLEDFGKLALPFAANILSAGLEVIGLQRVSLSPFEQVYMSIKNISVPDLFPVDDRESEVLQNIKNNARLHVMRSALVSADRRVSGLKCRDLHEAFEAIACKGSLDQMIESLPEWVLKANFERGIVPDWGKWSEPERLSERSRQQLLIAEEAGEAHTAEYDGPPGIGKTRIALMYALRTWEAEGKRRRVYWVLPRNDPAIALGSQIPRELNELLGDNHGISVEVFVGNERQAGLGCNLGESAASHAKSDIVITNIDFLVNGLITHGSADRIKDYASAICVFDEAHEFVSKNPLFFSFMVIMYARHRIARSRSFILTATPLPFHELWDEVGNRTKLIPFDRIPHVHNKETMVRVEAGISKLRNAAKGFVIFNSVSETIRCHLSKRTQFALHHKLTSGDKRAIISYMLSRYSEKNCSDASDDLVSAALIIQASFNIASPRVCESLLSFIKTMQTFGRCNRFGSFEESEFVLVDAAFGEDSSKSERAVISKVHSESLALAWRDALKDHVGTGREMSYMDLRRVYQSFVDSKKNEILQWIWSCLLASQKQLDQLPPLKAKSKAGMDGVGYASSGTMRGPSGSYYVSAARYFVADGKLKLDEKNPMLALDQLFQLDGVKAKPIAKALFSESDNTINIANMLNRVKASGFNYSLNKKIMQKNGEKVLLRMAKTTESPLWYKQVEKVYVGAGGDRQFALGLVDRKIADEFFAF